MVNKTNEKVLEHLTLFIQDRLNHDQAVVLTHFARLYYQSVNFEDNERLAIEDLYGALLAHWNLLLEFDGRFRIQVYNPTLEEHAWQSKHTIVQIVIRDMPFLLQSVCMEVNRLGYTNHLVIHPVITVNRNGQGQFLTLAETQCAETPHSDSGVHNECLIHLEIDRESDLTLMRQLNNKLQEILQDVCAATEDWPICLEKMQGIIDVLTEQANISEVVQDEIDFLRWLHDDHFVFLAYREYEIIRLNDQIGNRAVAGTGLGLLRDHLRPIPEDAFIAMTEDAFLAMKAPSPLMITKATSKATVHRPVFMDYIGVKQYDQQGLVIGEKRFLGLYSSSAYSTPLSEIPMISRKIKSIQQAFNFRKNSHSARALMFILNSLPRDEVFEADFDTLQEFTSGMLQLQQRQRVRVFVRQDVYGHFASLLIFVPRDRYYTETRKKIQLILQDIFKAQNIEFSVQLSESILARIHFIIHIEDGCCIDYDARSIEEQIIQALSDWNDELKDQLLNYHGEEKGNQLFTQYHEGFSAAYREDMSSRTALLDIEKFENLLNNHLTADSLLYCPLTPDTEKTLRFKLFSTGQVSLSKSLPMLENMGVKVSDERPYEITKKELSCTFWMHDFGLLLDMDPKQLDLHTLRPRFEETFEQCWFGQIENDGFNQLVLRAGIRWEQVNIFRGYYFYLRQIGLAFSQVYVETTLANNPEVVRLLVHYFTQRFDPELAKEDNSTQELYQTIEKTIDQIKSLDEDRILRRYLNLIQSAVRTNFFQYARDEQGIPYFSTKFDSGKILEIPSPVPHVEIFVYSPRMEGIHLRGGAVARGGIRWSDRREDFRTEVLGLMKAQMTKNAVIVPTGAKGGFIVKRYQDLETPEQKTAEVIGCYRVLIKGLLDITDNRHGAELIKPAQCVCYDGDDSYLVVAADKGTASFSDYANELAISYGFWLGDAFASGGSAGYDHKAMGITARGAWESVKHHFNRLKINHQERPFSVIGIGGMMGDVFGNGMLLSRQIKLIAAFDHEFIFLDPDPDPAVSYEERERLFRLPHARWCDYDSAKISNGGGVFSRTAKSIALSPQIKQRLNIQYEQLAPQQLIKLILTAPVDLLWNGGIGTYVKASLEQNMDVGDRANDPVRVNANELRCKQVAEGGNLGLTQAGRIEYALNGGFINTDSIDNSAGVDCSDHEVNIKIVLNQLVAQSDLTEKQRNELLESMTEEVGRLVLKHNYDQNRAITMIERASAEDPAGVKWLIEILEKRGNLNRKLEFIPDNEDLTERYHSGKGLQRPEISVLLAYSKQLLKQNVLAHIDELDSGTFKYQLKSYFPKQLQNLYATTIENHCLAAEIVANGLINQLINYLGIVLPFKLMDEYSCSIVPIINVYKRVCCAFDINETLEELELLDQHLDEQIREELQKQVRYLIQRSMQWFLIKSIHPQDFMHYVNGINELKQTSAYYLPEQGYAKMNQQVQYFMEKGVAGDLAVKIALMDVLYWGLDIIRLNQKNHAGLKDSAKAYFEVLAALDLYWLREQIDGLPEKTVWLILAKKAVEDEFNQLCCDLTLAILGNGQAVIEDKIQVLLNPDDANINRYNKLLNQARSDSQIEIEQITVLLKELKALV